VQPALADLAQSVSGVLAVPLSRAQGNWLVWLRPESVQEVTWGNVDKSLLRFEPDGELAVGKRESFERWSQRVRGRAWPWHPGEVQAVRGLRASLGTHLIARADELARLNAQLKQRVTRRTEELRATNEELEAFVYSVSHDLRAPLRAINGFSKMLSADYAEQLDERGQDYLSRVRAGTQRMGTMIDQLLLLSRVSHGELHREQIDLSDLARQIAVELQAAEPERRVEFAIADGLTATGDRELVRTVLENLLGNAWKFTSTREHARIEIAAREHDDRSAFVVRDNGVGFEMEHADQLFKAFKRLHQANEFPGTGIGLASVQRIINRHGGQIRARGEVGGGGATFTFTLEPGGDAR
jgi:light-regulated signal transduction histidine kinase (bacteriophytochrome)